jgi:short-subunit dehydrogenase
MGYTPCPGASIFAASKAYINYLTKGVQLEVQKQGNAGKLDLMLFTPGFIKSQRAEDSKFMKWLPFVLGTEA